MVLNLHDTYFVILISHLFLFFIFLFGVTSLIYILLDFFKVNILIWSVWFHVLGLIVATSILLYLNDLSNQFDAKQKTFEDFISPTDFNKYMFISILVFLSLQLLFIINIFVAIIKKMRLLRASQ